jgi:hypothetical protein
MKMLTLETVLPYLRRQIHHLKQLQISNPAQPDDGALFNPDYGLADPKLSGNFIVDCAYLFIAEQAINPSLLERAIWAADFLLKSQRPSGNIDLISVNYDSGPDTGFTVQQLCTIFELSWPLAWQNPQWKTLLEKLELFVRRAVGGMLTGGFHTPNHRWVIVSALVQAKAIFPDLEVKSVVEQYLAEGFDINAEGTFIERSVGVYDAVNTRSLLFIAEYGDIPEALEAVERNLNFNLHLLHADGTAETGLSRRQDYGTRETALGLAPCYLLSNHFKPDPVFVRAAQMLWEKSAAPQVHLGWLCYALLKCGDPEPTTASLPEDFIRHFPLNGICRVRRGLLSASFFQKTTTLLSLSYGQAELTSLKISQTYFGQYTGRFVGDSLELNGDQIVLRSEGVTNPRRPGYELPLGRPVPPEQWTALIQERSLYRLPPALSTLTAQEIEGGFNFRYRTLDGLDRVAAQIALDFPPGGIWETEDTRLMPQAGQVLFLKRGFGTMRYGNEVIRLEPGAYAHGMWQMRDAETAPNHVRVLLTFLTPVDFSFQLNAYQGL